MTTARGEEPPTLLVVEDDPSAIRLVEEAFADLDRPVTCLVATDGVEAFDVLHRRGRHADAPRPDLVLLDLDLPGRSGRQLLEEIRADESLRLLPVVVFSGSDDRETVDACYRRAANAYVVKPDDYDGMVSTAAALSDFWFETAARPGHAS